MSYVAKCVFCLCKIYMEDDFHEADTRVCEECLAEGKLDGDL